MPSPALPPILADDRPYANYQLRRQCGLTFRKFIALTEPRPPRGEDYEHNQFTTMTIPFDCEADYVAFADMFIEFVAPHSESPNRYLLRDFFGRNAVRAASITNLQRSESTMAIQFITAKSPGAVYNKELYHDSKAPVIDHTEGLITISATFAMRTNAEKVRFASLFARNKLRDFYGDGVTTHFTTIANCVPREGTEEETQFARDREAEEQMAQEAEQRAAPDSPVPSELMSDEEEEDEEEEEEEPNADRSVLQQVSDVLFDLKETMPDDSFVRLSNSLKRAHDQI